MIKDIFVFILACIIGTSCSNKTKRVNTNFNETHANKDIKPSKMSFASLGTFSNNVESALIPCCDLNIDKYIQKSKEFFDWVEIMEYPPHIFTCQNGCYFLLSTTKNATGLDTNFYHWLILNAKGEVIANIVSFSKNINNCYIKDGKIHMVTFDYDDEFFFKEQSERIPIKERNCIVGKTLILYKENKFYVEAR